MTGDRDRYLDLQKEWFDDVRQQVQRIDTNVNELKARVDVLWAKTAMWGAVGAAIGGALLHYVMSKLP